MNKIILIIAILSLLFSAKHSIPESSIDGEYEWTCTFSVESNYREIQITETKGNLIVNSFSEEIEFHYTEGESTYSFKLPRDSVYNSKNENEYKISELKNSENSRRELRSMFHLLSYAFLLKESEIYYGDSRAFVYEIIKKKKQEIVATIERRQLTDNLVFNISNHTNSPNYTDSVKGKFNINPKEKNNLECVFETYILTSAFLFETKGLITMRKK